MNTLARVGGFALSLIALFAAFSNWGIPQVVPDPPPERVSLGASATVEEFVALGRSTYERICALCHSGVGDRAPKLDRIGSVWKERTRDPRYRGAATSLEEYLRESMLNPSMFVVAGFGTPGSGDRESPMPDVSKGAIRLSAGEIDAVIAYLRSMAGEEVSVSSRAEQPRATRELRGATTEPDVAADAVAVLNRYQCAVCHRVAGIAAAEGTAAIGPDLRRFGERAGMLAPNGDTRGFIRRSILTPDASVAEGFPPGVMPSDFGQRMRAAELEMVVDYLATEH